MRLSQPSLILAAGAVLTLAACSDSGSPAGGAGLINLSIATRAPSGAPIMAAAPDTQVTGSDTLIIDSAQVVLRKIDLERVEDSASCSESFAAMDGDNEGDGGHEGDGDDGHEDACEELKAGPMILDLPLTPGTVQTFSVSVDTGTFEKAHFQIHRLVSNPEDQALLALHPEFDGISIRVVGTFNGTPFTYTNDVTANQQFRFSEPLAVGTAGPVDLTLLVDVNTWFVVGGVLVDPASAAGGQPNEGAVTHNIRNSFHTFHDEDHDCHDDDGDGEHHGGDDISAAALPARN
jgi:hypothetical protein